jgi:AMMECR1 domain-containing protein
VTIRERPTGALRGCVGGLTASRTNILEETVDRAVAAAASDPRFPPVRCWELPDLRFEVSVLGPSEDVAEVEDLDPATYGVIVSDARGRRGLLLPHLEGIESAERQVAIAREKAGIPAGEPVRIERFLTETWSEE